MRTMKAWVVTRYGGPDVLELRDVPVPRPVRAEVLIQVRATTVTAGDRRIRAMDVPYGFGPLFPLIFGRDQPKQPILGSEVAGVVTEIGPEVTRYKVGDKVFAYGDMKLGGHAEFLLIAETSALTHMPEEAEFSEAVALSFGPCTALAFLDRMKLRRGQTLLVNGAAGNVGSAAVQLGRHMGLRVTGVTRGENADLVRSIGAEDVIDYTQGKFTFGDRRWNAIFDAVGNLTYRQCRPYLERRGKLVLASASLPDLLRAPFLSIGSRKVYAGPANGTRSMLLLMSKLFTEKAYRPVIDRTLPFSELPEAHRIADSGRKRGSVVVTVGS